MLSRLRYAFLARVIGAVVSATLVSGCDQDPASSSQPADSSLFLDAAVPDLAQVELTIAAPACSNGMLDNGESDVDCGGTCLLPLTRIRRKLGRLRMAWSYGTRPARERASLWR